MVFLDGLVMELVAMACSNGLAWEVRSWPSGSLVSAAVVQSQVKVEVLLSNTVASSGCIPVGSFSVISAQNGQDCPVSSGQAAAVPC